MIKYTYILVILYNFNLFFTSFVNLMINNISLFNYKNTTNFTKNKQFYDILFVFFNYSNNFKKISYSVI